jgi:hypothetical protein
MAPLRRERLLKDSHYTRISVYPRDTASHRLYQAQPRMFNLAPMRYAPKLPRNLGNLSQPGCAKRMATG